MDDARFMQRALELAAKGRGNTSPNPMVGAIVVASGGAVVGEGNHERAGSDHAETIALRAAGDRARGATLYVTLEPCDHRGRTPACTQAIVEAGIRRVVVAIEDPDPRVRGKGIQQLRDAGIDVAVGVEASGAAALNFAYLHHRSRARSFVTLKMAASIDGAIAPRAGVRHRLTGAKAAAFVYDLRFEHDAVLIGVHTAITDNPELTVRPARPRAVPYLRIIADSNGRTPLASHVVQDAATTPTMVAATTAIPAERRDALLERGVQVVTCASTPDGHVDLADLLSQLAQQNILSVLCEGGPTIATALLAQKLVGKIYWFIAPEILGAATVAPAIDRVAGAARLHLESAVMLGEDLLVEAVPAT